jgi:hypothetical protein
MGLSDGRTVAMEFTARLVVAGDSTSGPRLQSYQVWAVCFVVSWDAASDSLTHLYRTRLH